MQPKTNPNQLKSEIQTSISSMVILPSTKSFMNFSNLKRTNEQRLKSPPSFDFTGYPSQILSKYQRKESKDHIPAISQANRTPITQSLHQPDLTAQEQILKCLKFLIQGFLQDASLFNVIAEKINILNTQEVVELIIRQALVVGGPLLANIFEALALFVIHNSSHAAVCPDKTYKKQKRKATFEQVASRLPKTVMSDQEPSNMIQVALYKQIDLVLEYIKGTNKYTGVENIGQQFCRKQRVARQDLLQKLEDHEDDDIIIEAQEKKNRDKKKRSSGYRGVSKNGFENWQIMSNSDGQKVYFGTVDNIVKAAIIYDIFTIQVKGLNAKTNFNYSKQELIAIMQLQSLLFIKEQSANKYN